MTDSSQPAAQRGPVDGGDSTKVAPSAPPADWPHILSVLKIGRIPQEMWDIIKETLTEDAAEEGWTLNWSPRHDGGDKDKRMKLILRRFTGRLGR